MQVVHLYVHSSAHSQSVSRAPTEDTWRQCLPQAHRCPIWSQMSSAQACGSLNIFLNLYKVQSHDSLLTFVKFINFLSIKAHTTDKNKCKLKWLERPRLVWETLNTKGQSQAPSDGHNWVLHRKGVSGGDLLLKFIRLNYLVFKWWMAFSLQISLVTLIPHKL